MFDPKAPSAQALEEDLRLLCTAVLGLGPNSLRSDTKLLGHLPELDSMSVATLLAAIEERFGFTIDDSHISADTFKTFGSLTDFVRHNLLPQ